MLFPPSSFAGSFGGGVSTGGGGVAAPLTLTGDDANTLLVEQADGTNALQINTTAGYLALGADAVRLYPEAPHTIAQRNEANAQTLRLYHTFVDTLNYERAKIAWESNKLVLGPESAGTGTARRARYLLGDGANTYIESLNPNQVRLVGGSVALLEAASNQMLTTQAWASSLAGIKAAAAGGGNTNRAGTNLTVASGESTGNGAPGAILFQSSTQGASGVTQQPLTEKWRISSDGHFLAGLDTTYDIGAPGATRPRDLHLARWLALANIQATAPAAGDCDVATEVGRVVIQDDVDADVTQRLCACVNTAAAGYAWRCVNLSS